METYVRIVFWLRVGMLPVAVAVIVWGAVEGLPLLVVGGLLLLGSSALFLWGAAARRRS